MIFSSILTKKNEREFTRFKGFSLSILNKEVHFPALLSANHSTNKLEKINGSSQLLSCLN